MAVKVLVERRVRRGYEEAVWEMLRDLRSQAVRIHGHIYSETWRSVANPRVLVTLSTWASKEAWDAWANDPFRMKADERINRMLVGASRVRIFEETAGPPLVIRKP
jgi:heme-degrading monooxygenase HmoA